MTLFDLLVVEHYFLLICTPFSSFFYEFKNGFVNSGYMTPQGTKLNGIGDIVPDKKACCPGLEYTVSLVVGYVFIQLLGHKQDAA